MELFHEIYSSYINVVQRILTEAHQSPITLGRMEQIAAENAFAESALAILPKLTGDDWPLLTAGIIPFVPDSPILRIFRSAPFRNPG